MVRSPIQHTELSLQASPDPITRHDPPAPSPELPGVRMEGQPAPKSLWEGFRGERKPELDRFREIRRIDVSRKSAILVLPNW